MGGALDVQPLRVKPRLCLESQRAHLKKKDTKRLRIDNRLGFLTKYLIEGRSTTV